MKFEHKNLVISLFLSFVGAVFLIYYVFRASCDVVLSDYIRIVNTYLEDVKDLHYLFSWESISRVPITFIFRYINVIYFHYSVYFDKFLGIFFLGILNFLNTYYLLKIIKNKYLKVFSVIVSCLIVFSLMGWEMILNGTGYPHYIAIALYFICLINFNNFFITDNFKYFIILFFLIPFTSLICAGSYAVSFICIFVLFLILKIIINIYTKNNQKLHLSFLLIIVSVISILCYFKSNNTGEPLSVSFTYDISFTTLLKKDILFPIKFLIKSLASIIIGVETFNYAIVFKTCDEKMIYVVGVIMLILILWTMFLFVYLLKTNIEIIKNNIFTVMFLFIGLLNLCLVLLARYKFLRTDYGMSSRYFLQYMFLSIGIIWINILFLDNIKFVHNIKKVFVFFSIVCVLIIAYGNIITTIDELGRADLRKIVYNNLVNVAKNYENYTDEELKNYFEYHRDVEHIKNSLSILKKYKLNVFNK